MTEPSFDGAQDDGDEDNSSQDSNPMKELRDHTKALERERKTLTKELDELRAWKADREHADRSKSVTGVFSDLGLGEKQAELYMKLNPEAESVEPGDARAFAEEYGWAVTSSDEESADTSAGFSPSQASSGIPAKGQRLSSEDFWKLVKENQAEALKMARDGRVDFKTTND